MKTTRQLTKTRCKCTKKHATIRVIFLILCAFAFMNINAQTGKVSLQLRNASVKELFNSIEKQTPYRFSYRDNEIEGKGNINVSATHKELKQILENELSKNGLSFNVMGYKIIVTAAQTNVHKKHNEATGRVTDINGEPIIGATIKEKGTSNGTITDMNGDFRLNVTENATLEISYIGYKSKEVQNIAGRMLAVTLTEDAKLLDEVVVIGYGTMKKSDLTGAISNIEGNALAKRKTTQLSTALQGSIAGLTVTRNGSDPSAGAGSIYVRGITTMSDTSPLVIVDGVPGSIDQVSPNDVENITVLKDAASASIYGSRAAAGVILITTKRASEKQLSLNYTGDFTFEIPTLQPEYVDVNRYLAIANELAYNDNPKGGLYQIYTQEEQNNWMELHRNAPDKYPYTDWNSLLLKNHSFKQNHTVNISGGTKNVKSKVSLSYNDADALYDGYKYQRFMVRSNNDFNISKFIGARLDFNWIHSKTTKPQYDPFSLDGVRAMPAIFPAFWENGGYAGEKNGYNPYARLKDGGNQTGWGNQLRGKAELFITPIDGLKLSATVAPSYHFSKSKSFIKQIKYVSKDDPTEYVGFIDGHNTTNLVENRDDSYNITTQFLINYDKKIKDHSLNVLGGYEDYYYFFEKLGASRQQYVLTSFPYLNMGPEEFQFNSGSADHYAYRSFFGRFIYGYKNKYLLQANVRFDASSRFAEGYRWGNFPSFSLGWVVTEEDFIKKLNLDWLSHFKLRASYGSLGNERIGNYHPYQGMLTFETNILYNSLGIANMMPSAAQWNYAVHDITWETTTSYNLGVDAAFFDNRLTMSFDYYKKKTEDMLLSTQIPGILGYGNPSVNAGEMYTKGFELNLGWRDNIGDLNYSVAFNLSDFVSRMGNLNGTEFLGSTIKKEGSEFNEWYGYLSDGLFLTEEDLKNSPKLNNNVKVGDIKYKDISGPDGVPDGKISPEYDKVLLGGSLPRFSFGMNIGLEYKNFDLSVVFQGVGSQNKMYSTAMMEPYRYSWMKTPAIIDGKYWSSFKTEEENAAVMFPRLTKANATANYGTTTDFWMFNGRYLRLKNVTLGYNLPKHLLQPIFIKGVRIYVAANDLFCLSGYPKGWDPEMASTAYPITTSLITGISVNF